LLAASLPGDRRAYFRDAGFAGNALVRRTVAYDGPDDLRGGVKGSFPVDGDYVRFQYLNWATKFFIDSNQAEASIRAAENGQDDADLSRSAESRARAEGPSCASNVSALARAAPSRIKKQSRKRWSLNEIVCDHCIKHRSDEWLLDKPMIHSARPNRLTPGAQDVGSENGETASFSTSDHRMVQVMPLF
jgi:hypothetical protein